MGLWKRVKEDSERGIQIVKAKVFVLGRQVVEQTETTKRRLLIRKLEGTTDEMLARLGEKAFKMADRKSGDLFREREVLDLVAKIEDLRKRKKVLEDEIRTLQEGPEG